MHALYKLKLSADMRQTYAFGKLVPLSADSECMKKIFVIMMSMLLLSCHTSPDKASQETEVCQSVDSIYSQVFAWYAKAEKDLSLLQESPDFEALYTSSDYNKLFREVKAIDDSIPAGEAVGFFDYDHWVCGQDFQDLSMTIASCTKEDAQRCSVVVKVHNCGTDSFVRLDMVHEEGRWLIDDFCMLPDATTAPDASLSEKARMREYVSR